MTFDTELVANIETVLSTTIGFNLEDLSGIDQNSWPAADNPVAQLLRAPTMTEYGDTSGERPATDTDYFTVKIGFRNDDPADTRDKQKYWVNKCRDNITVANIDDTTDSVRFVTHQGAEIEEYNGSYTIIGFNFGVRYRR